MSDQSEKLFQQSKILVPGGVHSPVRSFSGQFRTPLFMEQANEALISDIDGKDYIDFCMSFGPLILGHQNPKVKNAISEGLNKGWSFGACERYSLELAEFIVQRVSHVDQIRFVNSGTEAVMTALRLARGFTKKDKVIKFNGCYHGHTDSMLIKAGSGLAGTSEASSNGIPKSIAGDTLVAELGDKESVLQFFKDHSNEIAAIIIEPQPANYGLLKIDPDYLKFLRKICTDNDTLLIFDEVISGFRLSFAGVAGQLGIIPDLVTYGKVIGGGLPVGAVGGKEDIMKKLAPVGDVYQAGTLSANPLAMVAGLATLKQLTPETYAELDKSADKICEIFKSYFKKNEAYKNLNIYNVHSLFWICAGEQPHSVPTIPSTLGEDFYPLFQDLIQRGVYLAPNAYEVGFVSTAHSGDLLKTLESRLC